jgi:hypothetical protein
MVQAYVLSEFSRFAATRAVALEEICFYTARRIA